MGLYSRVVLLGLVVLTILAALVNDELFEVMKSLLAIVGAFTVAVFLACLYYEISEGK